MASTSASAPAAAATPPAAPAASPGHDITDLKNKVYDESVRLTEEDTKIVFHQNDILDMEFMRGVDVNTLLAIINELLKAKLYKVVQDADGMGWKTRTREEAKRYSTLSPEQEMVYSHIDESGAEGIWIRTVKMRSKLHDSVVNAALKQLEGKSLVSTIKSVEHPTRKMYIKSTIRPSERATGGPFYTDGELDEEFVDMMKRYLVKYISEKSFYRSSTLLRNANKTIKMSAEEAKSARDKGLGPRNQPVDSARAARIRNYESMVPMPHGYAGYPGVHEMTAMIEDRKVTNTTLTAAEIQQLLDVLCFDDLIERVEGGKEGFSYRALRKSLLDDAEGGSVLTEMPCGRCPVFDLCEEGGPVSPSSCIYYNDWLEL
ncbi:putative DNA-directed RNA polymerase III subunit rpc6 [Lachnellula cervina]|uniref:DNA-directed RNA polymerase III subunit RPC6 n=1 Tax=Lachnellula cervina TaxID=1316786 RepID=A0A7D8Z139_9HELO|nr:putative DNA-directed RNA polymerase III subunit rpc6 [Lachnellula cervina]